MASGGQPHTLGFSCGQAAQAGAASHTTNGIDDAPVLLKLVLSCSHDGDVQCVEGATGAAVWVARLPSRADAGLCVTADLRHVAVACGDGRLYCLELATGALMGSTDLGGEPKAPAAVAPWDGSMWATSHGRQVVVLDMAGGVLARCVGILQV